MSYSKQEMIETIEKSIEEVAKKKMEHIEKQEYEEAAQYRDREKSLRESLKFLKAGLV